MGKSARIVCEPVVVARYKIMARDIAMTPLMHSLEAEETCGSGDRRDSTLALPVYRRGIVGMACYGAFADIVVMGDGLVMEIAAC